MSLPKAKVVYANRDSTIGMFQRTSKCVIIPPHVARTQQTKIS